MTFSEQLNSYLDEEGYTSDANLNHHVPETIEELDAFIAKYYFPKQNLLHKQQVKDALIMHLVADNLGDYGFLDRYKERVFGELNLK